MKDGKSLCCQTLDRNGNICYTENILPDWGELMKVLCFGDSNTYGYDPRGYFGGRYDPEDRWPDILGVQTGWEICNEGLNGREIPRNSALSRVDADMVLLMLGTNDLLQGVSAEEAARRMDVFLKQALAVWGKIVLIAPPPVKRGEWVASESLIRESVQLAEEYRRIAQARKIPFVDTREWDIGLCFDGVHFTEKGHHIFALRLAETLMKMI